MLLDPSRLRKIGLIAGISALLLVSAARLQAQQEEKEFSLPSWEQIKTQPSKLTEKYADKKFKQVDLSEYGLPVTVDLLETMEVEQVYSLPQVEITDTANDRFSMRLEFGKPTPRVLLNRLREAFEVSASLTQRTPQEFMQDKEFHRFDNPPTLAFSRPDPWGDPGRVFSAWSTRPVGKFDYQVSIGALSLNDPKLDELQLSLHIFRSLTSKPGPPKTILEELAVRGVDVDYVDDPSEIDSLEFGVTHRFSEAGYEFLAPLKNLESVNHGYTPATDKLLEALQDKKKLGRLRVPKGDITDVGLAYLKDKHELFSLNLDSTLITDQGLANLTELKNLRVLSLSDTQITVAGLAHLAGLDSLTSLDLADTAIDDAGLRHLAGLNDLKNLNLYDNQLEGSGLKHLAGLSELSVLNLAKNPRLKPENIAAMSDIESLAIISLVDTPITPDALTALPPDSLQTLELGGTPTTDAQLEKLKHFTRLKSLGIRDCDQIDGSGFVHLKEIKTLESLSIPRTLSRDALLKLQELTQLKSLNLDKFKTLPEDHHYYQRADVEELKTARPDMSVW